MEIFCLFWREDVGCWLVAALLPNRESCDQEGWSKPPTPRKQPQYQSFGGHAIARRVFSVVVKGWGTLGDLPVLLPPPRGAAFRSPPGDYPKTPKMLYIRFSTLFTSPQITSKGSSTVFSEPEASVGHFINASTDFLLRNSFLFLLNFFFVYLKYIYFFSGHAF